MAHIRQDSRHRIERLSAPTLDLVREQRRARHPEAVPEDAMVECGWGKLIFAHTFSDNERLAQAICEEPEHKRNIALYLRDPHVVLMLRPQELFLDPSHTYRLWLSTYRPARILPAGFRIRMVSRERDADALNRLLLSRRMVPIDAEFVWAQRHSRTLSFFVAEGEDGHVIGMVMGVDHRAAFGDPENGASMWCLAVDPQAALPGVGRALVAHAADHFSARGRSFMDLSVMHDNRAVIALYEKMGFRRVAAFCVKKKNSINETLYLGPPPDQTLNPYAEIIVREARRRGIAVDVLDADYGYFSLTLGGRSIVCRESLSELTTAIAMSRCDDKRVTSRLLAGADLQVPEQRIADGSPGDREFLARHGAVVVKPVSGEQGQGVSVNIREPDELAHAVHESRRFASEVILERCVEGEDLRVVLIDYKVVAAAIRRPARVVGNGQHSLRELIEKQSRRRAAATGGESRIPLDEQTERSIKRAGYTLDSVPAEGVEIQVRDTANLHTGGTLHDVTGELSAALRSACEKAARVLDIPVVGLDLMVPAPDGEQYVIIEANERPGLANHEPQPTAERFVDLLFPQTAAG